MKKLTVLLFLVLTFSPVFAQSNSAQTYRVYYMGKIDETPAFLEMLITDLSVSGVLGFRQETMFSVAGLISPSAENAPASALLRITDDAGVMNGQLRFNLEENQLRGALVYKGKNFNVLFEILAVYMNETTILKNDLSYSVQYPYFLPAKYAPLNEAIRGEILKANAALTDHFSDPQKMTRAMEGILKYDRIDSFEIQFAGSKIISILNSSYFYTGGAHGNYVYESFNYAVSDDQFRRLELSSILSLNSARFNLLNRLLVEKLKEKKATFVLDGSVNAFEMGELSPSFSIKENGFVFTFAPYMVDAYAAGTYEIFISFDEIRMALSEDFKSLLDPEQ